MMAPAVCSFTLILNIVRTSFSVTLRDNQVYFYGAKSVAFEEHSHSVSSGQPYEGTTCSGNKCNVKAGRHGSYEVAGNFKAGMAALNVVSGGHVGIITALPEKLNFAVEGYFDFEMNPTSCSRDTGGTCRFLSCDSSRGATDCTNNQCLCKAGYCVSGGKCVRPEEVGGEKYKCWLRLAQGHNMFYNPWWLGYKNCVGATRAIGNVITCWCGLSFSGGSGSNEFVVSVDTAALLSEQVNNYSVDASTSQVGVPLGDNMAADTHLRWNFFAIAVACAVAMTVITLFRVLGKRSTSTTEPLLHIHA